MANLTKLSSTQVKHGDKTLQEILDGTISGQMYGDAEVKAIFYNAVHISENLTILAGTNGGSFGEIIIDDGYTVTVEDGSVWSIV